jgi:hypothetical protein
VSRRHGGVSSPRGIMASATFRRSWWSLLPAGLAVFCLVALPVILVPAALVWAMLRRHPDRLASWLTMLAAAPEVMLVGMLGVDYRSSWTAVLGALMHGRTVASSDVAAAVLWGVSLGPILGAAWWRVDQFWRETAPMAGPAERARREAVEAARRRRTVHVVQDTAHAGRAPRPLVCAARPLAVPLTYGGDPVLGLRLAGDLAWPAQRTPVGHLLTLPRSAVHHLVVLGATGAGKSEIVWRVVESTIRRGREQVIYVNAKEPSPGREPSLRLAAVAAASGRSCRVLVKEAGPWNTMRGTPDKIRQRLLNTEEWTEPYYMHASNVLLALALDLHHAAGEPLRTLPDLVWGLRRERLEELASSDPRAAELVELMSDATVEGSVLRWASQTLMMRGWIGADEDGAWSWEDAEVIGVDLPTSTEPDAARALLRAMLTDLEGWITDPSRRPFDPATGRPRPLTLVIEELSALDADPVLGRRVVNLVERARGADVRVIVVAQGPSGLGDERAVEALLTNCAVVSCRQTDGAAVERLAGLSGTEEREEASVAYRGNVRASEGSIRVQHAYRVNPNRFRRLGTGEVIVMFAGQWAQLAVGMTAAGYALPASRELEALEAVLGAARASALELPPLPVYVPGAGREGPSEASADGLGGPDCAV